MKARQHGRGDECFGTLDESSRPQVEGDALASPDREIEGLGAFNA
jgi:hypothetical protein